MKKILIASMAAASLLAVGCASTGNEVLKDETQESVAAKLSPGMTQEEVQAIYGQPLETNFTDSGNEIWKYQFVKSKATAEILIPYSGGSKGKAKTLMIFFGQDGRLVRHTMSTSDVRSKGGLIG